MERSISQMRRPETLAKEQPYSCDLWSWGITGAGFRFFAGFVANAATVEAGEGNAHGMLIWCSGHEIWRYFILVLSHREGVCSLLMS